MVESAVCASDGCWNSLTLGSKKKRLEAWKVSLLAGLSRGLVGERLEVRLLEKGKWARAIRCLLNAFERIE